MNIGKDDFKIQVCGALFGCHLQRAKGNDGYEECTQYECAICETEIDITNWVHAKHTEDCIINDVRDYLALYKPELTSSHGKEWHSRFKEQLRRTRRMMKFWSFPPMTDSDHLLMEFHAILKNPGAITDAYRDHLIRRIEQRLAGPAEGPPSPEAIELLEVCRGCDLMYDAAPSLGLGNVVAGVAITDRTSVADLVDAFLAQHKAHGIAYVDDQLDPALRVGKPEKK